ncbi:alpha/beta fold hydrolase [Nocardia spumae]|uniref:alpha/beta fold hydrolase n=1 Tax=Nocardia spumae TaxID=2887190 RepID=UPI001D15816F|nr:alpha/beta fold hydrolase [Nocardia spumae]
MERPTTCGDATGGDVSWLIVESNVIRVPLAGVQIAYRDSGIAPVSHPFSEVPVLLVHGMGGDGHTWDRFATALIRSGRRVIIPDLRGHGRSGRTATYPFDDFGADLLRLCERLELSTVDLVGHSLGGYACSWAAIERPELVRKLVLEEQPLPLRSGDEQFNPTRRLPSVPELWHATTSVIRHPRAVLAFDRSMTAPALEQFRKPHPEWWEGLTGITAPTLMLRGGPGGMVDPEKLEMFRARVPDCRVQSFSCGHSIHRDRYREFAAVVLPFLGQ